MRYIFYPGCNAEQVEKEALNSTYAVCDKLGIELIYADNFSCCGATHLDKVDNFLSLLVNARNLAYAAQSGLPVMVICNTCYSVMKRTQYRLANDEEMLEKVNTELSRIGIQYKPGVEVKHFYEVLYDDYDIDELQKHVVKELDALKVAPFYGCHILRPEKELGIESEEAEAKVDEIIAVLGAEVVNYERESACCGFHITMANPQLSAKMNGKNMLSAKKEEADLIVTPCTLCHTVMDGQQHRAEKAVGEKIRMPILHLPQLVGLAIGLDEKTLGLKRHIVSCNNVLNKIIYGTPEEELVYEKEDAEKEEIEKQETGEQILKTGQVTETGKENWPEVPEPEDKTDDDPLSYKS